MTTDKPQPAKNQFNQPLGQKIENWQGAKKPELVTLSGNYCTLEPLDTNKHAATLFENLSHDNPGDSWTYLPYGPFTKLSEFCEWIEKTNRMELDTLLYAILDKDSTPIGVAGYLRINPTHGSIEVGHLHYSKFLQKTPAATEAMYLMMRYAFEELNYRRYEWKCNSLNEPSKSAALRLGFTFEGTFRQSNVFKNHNRDTCWYSIIDSEWSLIKNKMQRWLDPMNFSEDGKQKLSLNELIL